MKNFNAQTDQSESAAPALLREEIGEVLRAYRQRQGRTLREVSSDARVSLGYLSEVERGQKEASSELLASICRALNVPLSQVLRLAADRIDLAEGRLPAHLRIPDSVPEDLVRRELSKREFSEMVR
ncbi:helix-turn-helix domain-containing protein [Actinobaculum massiliense]|nr:helix-turn-helix transcriptional regulator [Actinobaculum massiliense]MDK8318362.1 helix-turn-helix transcriptional regulator [Actinobaculum massiliense]MDK8566777.1 helix-turn-helix transcriptional regulator [Actinobaculum massiliense]